MWKHVNSRCGVLKIPSYLGSGLALQGSPQLPEDAISQDDIDALFDNL